MRRSRAEVSARVVGSALAGGALGFAVWGVLHASSVTAEPAFLVAIGVTAALVVALVSASRTSTKPAEESAVDDHAGGRTVLAVTEIIMLEHRLAWGSIDAERYETRVRPLLVDLVAERLRIRHGVDHTREPDRARSIVGDRLWQLMTGPARTPRLRSGAPPSQRALARIITEIERI